MMQVLGQLSTDMFSFENMAFPQHNLLITASGMNNTYQVDRRLPPYERRLAQRTAMDQHLNGDTEVSSPFILLAGDVCTLDTILHWRLL